MKSVLISIQPKWCELIASGKKTVEVRKTKPKLEVPFKVYIYCTRNNRKHALHAYVNSGYGRKNFGAIGHWRSGKDVVDVNSHLPAYRYNAYLAECKVIGEFVCDSIEEIEYQPNYYICNLGTQLSNSEMWEYGRGKPLYAWHISDLVIYDEPKELSEFWTIKCTNKKGSCGDCETKPSCINPITRPPQSWCYVEERGE